MVFPTAKLRLSFLKINIESKLCYPQLGEMMMGFLGMGNNPMVGATVAVAVAVQQAMK